MVEHLEVRPLKHGSGCLVRCPSFSTEDFELTLKGNWPASFLIYSIRVFLSQVESTTVAAHKNLKNRQHLVQYFQLRDICGVPCRPFDGDLLQILQLLQSERKELD